MQTVTAAMKLKVTCSGRKALTNLDIELKSRHITFPTKICLAKGMISQVVMYRYGEGNGNPLQYSCLENPRMEEPGGLPSMGSHRVRYD